MKKAHQPNLIMIMGSSALAVILTYSYITLYLTDHAKDLFMTVFAFVILGLTAVGFLMKKSWMMIAASSAYVLGFILTYYLNQEALITLPLSFNLEWLISGIIIFLIGLLLQYLYLKFYSKHA